MTIRVGTASWTDPSLIKCGKFYPKGCTSPEDRLRHYADQFPMVEVDSSYYALPAPANVEKWVQRTPDDFVLIFEACQAQLPDHLLAVEFRDQSWFEGEHRERVLDFERDRGLVNVTVDEPQNARNSIPTVWDVTSPRLAILRMHGQNAATWNVKADVASERFNYDYDTEDLAAFVAPILRLEEQAIEVHVIFNNNYEDQGQRNARTLMQA